MSRTMDQNTQIIHPNYRTPKNIILTPQGIDDNYNLYIHSKSEMSQSKSINITYGIFS